MFFSPRGRTVLRAWQITGRVFGLLLIALSLTSSAAQAQGGSVDIGGTGGRHTIQGNIFFPSGRRPDARIQVKLESTGAGAVSVFADGNGSFSFRNLSAGSYSVVIDGRQEYETVRESIYIDQVKSRSMVDSTARVYTLPIYLQVKSGNRSLAGKPGVLDVSLANVPKAAVELYQQAVQLSQKNEHKSAALQLQKAIELHPEFSLALNELGVQYLKLGQAEKAAEALASAVKLAPEDNSIRLNYGIALLNKNDFEGARQQLQNVIKTNDTSATAHMYLGITFMRLKKLGEAERELVRATSLGKQEVGMAHKYLGGIYWGKREYKRAAEELEKYLLLTPKAPDADRIRTTIQELRSKE